MYLVSTIDVYYRFLTLSFQHSFLLIQVDNVFLGTAHFRAAGVLGFSFRTFFSALVLSLADII